jgi:hypothetical protein
VRALLAELPPRVELVAACKTRSPGEVLEAIEAGITIAGENYLQEAQEAYALIGTRVRWHFIGTLQKNKVKTAVRLFDMIETVDSLALAEALNNACLGMGKTMPVLLEINSGREAQKSGLLPEDAVDVARSISALSNIKVMGLMTMGPRFGNPEDARPCFAATNRLFEELKKLALPGLDMRYLSMGMTNSYRVAIKEGANLVRIGSKIFGER